MAALLAAAAIGGPNEAPVAGRNASAPTETDSAFNATAERALLLTERAEAASEARSKAAHAAQVEVVRARETAHARAVLAGRVRTSVRANRERVKRLRPSWVLPVIDYRLTAGFAQQGDRWSSGQHTGLDFAAPTGSAVRAIGAGSIVSAGGSGANGIRIVVRHTDGTVSWYAHLSAIVRASGRVNGGEVIGKVGNTGNSTGPHLHLEVRPRNRNPVDPRTWLTEHGVTP